MTPANKHIWKAWIAAILWLTVIFFESSDWMSFSNTSRILYPLLHWLTGVDAVQFVEWNFYIRKVGHFCGYFALSWLLFRAWRATLPALSSLKWSGRWAAIAFVMTALVATLDEWHQMYLPSRTGTIHDVVLDSTGALSAQLLLFIWLWLRANPPSVVRSA
ncbi:MAG TPA: VanZ family protein [Terriglobales bacterium]|nr:VanZ family protein [Terriglobales bacterium]